MMFTSLVLLTLLPAVLGQSWQQYLNGLVQGLNSDGLTALASASAALNSTPNGQQVAQSLSTGNWTLFAPSNQACKYSDMRPYDSATILVVQLILLLSISQAIQHLFGTSFHTMSYPAISPIKPLRIQTSLLGERCLTIHHLSGWRAMNHKFWHGQREAMAYSCSTMGEIFHVYLSINCLQVAFSTTVSVVNKTSYQNLQVLVIDSVLQIPQNLSDTISNSTYDLTTLAGGLSSITIPTPNSPTLLNVLNNASGITLFAPNNSALATASCIGGLLPNSTALIALFGNHVCPLIQFISLCLTPDPGYQWHDCLLASVYKRK